MKITKQRIKEIIKEEMQFASSEMDLKKKMKELSDAMANDQVNINPAEAEEVDKMITRILAAASAEEVSTTDLRKANEYVAKYLNVDTITEDALEEVQPSYGRAKISRKLTLLLKDKPDTAKEKIIVDFFKIIKSGEGYEKLFPKWKDLDDAKKKEVIDAGKEFNINKGRAKQYADKIIAASTPQETEEAVEDLINDVEQQTELDFGSSSVPVVVGGPATAGTAGEQIDISAAKDKYSEPIAQLGLERDENTALLKFIQFMLNNKMISENLGKGLRHFEFDEDTKNALLRSMTQPEKKAINSAFKKIYSDKNKLEAFLSLFDKKDTPAAEPAKEGEVEVEVGDREYTYTKENIQQLKTAYEAFEKNFMTVLTLRDQEELWIDLRNALNNIGKFRTIGRREQALTTESINIHEEKNTQKAKILIRDLERLRKDFNDTDEVLKQYIVEAKEGNYQAKAYLARFLAEIKDVQNSIEKTVDDTKKLTRIEPVEEQITEAEEEEETRDQKIQNVRNVYENIKDLLGGALPEIGKNVGADFKEVSGNVKESYDELMKIRHYFRNVGAFAKTSDKDVEELQQDYLIIKNGVSKSMSRFIDDLRRGRIQETNVSPFLENMARIGEFITEKFGVGPDKGYGFKTIEVPSDGVTRDEIESNTDETGAEAFNPEGSEEGETEEAPPDAGMPDPDEVKPEKIQKDVETFVKKSNKFLKDIIVPFAKAINTDDKTGILRVKRTLADLMKQKLVETKENEENMADLVDQVESAKDLLTDIIIFLETDEILKIKDNILKPLLRDYNKIHKKLVTVYDKPLENFIDAMGDIDKNIQQDIESMKPKVKQIIKFQTLDDTPDSKPFKQEMMFFVSSDVIPDSVDKGISRARLKQINNIYDEFKKEDPDQQATFKVSGVPKVELEESKNLLERLIKQELKVLNGKKMVRN